MKHLLSKVKSLFKPKERIEPSWVLDKDFFKKANANIHLEEWDASNIYAEKIDASKIKEVWKK